MIRAKCTLRTRPEPALSLPRAGGLVHSIRPEEPGSFVSEFRFGKQNLQSLQSPRQGELRTVSQTRLYRLCYMEPPIVSRKRFTAKFTKDRSLRPSLRPSHHESRCLRSSNHFRFFIYRFFESASFANFLAGRSSL